MALDYEFLKIDKGFRFFYVQQQIMICEIKKKTATTTSRDFLSTAQMKFNFKARIQINQSILIVNSIVIEKEKLWKKTLIKTICKFKF